MAETRRLAGRVQRLIDGREFGFVVVVPDPDRFIEGTKPAEYFIHRALFTDPGEFDLLVVGDRVTFEPRTSDKGLRGVNIERG